MTPKNDVYPFGDMVLTLPSKHTATRDGKSSKAADLHVPMNMANGLVMEIVTAVWATPVKIAGVDKTQFGVSLPRGIRARPDDPISASVVERFKEEAITAFDAWIDTAQTQGGLTKPASTAGRLVR